MEYRTFGTTGLRVSAIGLGAFPLSGMRQQSDGRMLGWTGTDDREAVALIHRGEELGVNLIDTAESYGAGHSEIITGKALAGRRDRWIVATKVSPFTRPSPNMGSAGSPLTAATARQRIIEACEGSLRRLQMDHIDLYQLHAIPAAPAMPAVMEALATLREQGKVRWYGISTNDRAAIRQLRALGPIDVLQIGYNLLERRGRCLATPVSGRADWDADPRAIGQGDAHREVRRGAGGGRAGERRALRPLPAAGVGGCAAEVTAARLPRRRDGPDDGAGGAALRVGSPRRVVCDCRRQEPGANRRERGRGRGALAVGDGNAAGAGDCGHDPHAGLDLEVAAGARHACTRSAALP